MESGAPPSGIALALARLGAHSSRRLAERLAEEGLAPPHLGVLRAVGTTPGISQRALARTLGVAPSRVVALVDELEAEGLVERRRSASDRRQHELHLAVSGAARMKRVRAIVRDHDAELTSALTPDERTQLLTLLTRIAEARDL